MLHNFRGDTLLEQPMGLKVFSIGFQAQNMAHDAPSSISLFDTAMKMKISA